MELSKNAKEVLVARSDFSKLFGCFSVVHTEKNFSTSGCDCCSNTEVGGAGDVLSVEYLAQTDIASENWSNTYDGKLCSDCLGSFVNADDSDLQLIE